MHCGRPVSSASTLEVLVEALLRRLVVVGSDLQGRVGADLLGELGQPQGLGRAVRAGAGHHLDPAGHRLDDEGDHPLVLVVRQRGRFAGRADRAEAVRAGRDLELDLLPEDVVVDLAVGKRRDQGDRQTGKCFTLRAHSIFKGLNSRDLRRKKSFPLAKMIGFAAPAGNWPPAKSRLFQIARFRRQLASAIFSRRGETRRHRRG